MPTIKETILSSIRLIDEICSSMGTPLTSDAPILFLKSHLESSIKDKNNDDFDFGYSDLIDLKLFTEIQILAPFDKIAQTLQTVIEDKLSQRSLLARKVVDFLLSYHTINASFLDQEKIDDELLHLCKRVFKVDDVYAYVQQTSLLELMQQISLSHILSKHLLLINLTKRQKHFEQVLVDLAKARESVSPKRFDAGEYVLSQEIQEKFTALKRYGRNPFGPSSAPNTAREPIAIPSPRQAISQPTTPKGHQPVTLRNLLNFEEAKPSDDTQDNDRKANVSKSRVSSTPSPIPPLRFSRTLELSHGIAELNLDVDSQKEKKRLTKK